MREGTEGSKRLGWMTEARTFRLIKRKNENTLACVTGLEGVSRRSPQHSRSNRKGASVLDPWVAEMSNMLHACTVKSLSRRHVERAYTFC